MRKMSVAHAENSCQSDFGAPNSSQMIGMGYGSQNSTARSAWPRSVNVSSNPVTTDRMYGAERVGMAWRERRPDEPPQSRVLVALGRQDRRASPCEPVGVVDPRQLEQLTRRTVPALVAQHRDDVVVVQHGVPEDVAGEPARAGCGIGCGAVLGVRDRGIVEPAQVGKVEGGCQGRHVGNPTCRCEGRAPPDGRWLERVERRGIQRPRRPRRSRTGASVATELVSGPTVATMSSIDGADPVRDARASAASRPGVRATCRSSRR